MCLYNPATRHVVQLGGKSSAGREAPFYSTILP